MALGAGLFVVGSLMKAYSMYAEGKQTAKNIGYNRAVNSANSMIQISEINFNKKKEERKGNQALGQLGAAYAKAGVVGMAGSAMHNYVKTAFEVEMNLFTYEQAKLKAMFGAQSTDALLATKEKYAEKTAITNSVGSLLTSLGTGTLAYGGGKAVAAKGVIDSSSVTSTSDPLALNNTSQANNSAAINQLFLGSA